MKFGISHFVHLAGQLSHSCLLLLAIKFEFSHTPSLFVDTQLPLRLYVPAPQMMQSFDVGPLHV